MVVILKTLRTSREFFPDLIVYHSHQSDRKIYKKHILIPTPALVSHGSAWNIPFHTILARAKVPNTIQGGTQLFIVITVRDCRGFFLSHPMSRMSV